MAPPPDLVIVDTRGDASSAMPGIERLRAASPGAGIFAIALSRRSRSDPSVDARRGATSSSPGRPPTKRSTARFDAPAARRETAQGARPAATTLVFFGAKGGAGTTTVAVNCGVELARLSKQPTVIVDLKPGLGEVALFLGVRPRYSILDAIDNLHRLDREFLRELVVKHKSGLEILAGSDQFDRPGAADGGAIEELLRLLARQYGYILVDAGSQINACTVAALYAADQMFLVAQPGRAVGPQRAAAARSRAPARRVRRARARRCSTAPPEPYPDSAEADRGRARPSDSPHVPERLQDRVDGAQLRRAAGAGRQLRTSRRSSTRFTRRILDPGADDPVAAPASAACSASNVIASIW